MRFPLSWLAEFVEIPADKSAAEISEIFTALGFEEEEVLDFGSEIVGPIVVGKILEFTEEPQANGKTIRWCQVDVGTGVHGIVCGARNFEVGDKVVVSLPGAILPGGFTIAARKTYGHVSDGMICSARELKFNDDHDGIIRLGELGLNPELGTDAIELLKLRDSVIDLSVLPDRGYAMSIRGLARELAAITGWKWTDPAAIAANIESTAAAVRAEISGADVAQRIVLRTLHNFNPAAKSPIWMQRRLYLAGMRSISLAVDVTNYVMLELGQPLHAFDANKLQGHIRVQRSGGVEIKTLDNQLRQLDTADVVIADDSGAIAIAGVMGGATTEIDENSTSIVIEAATFIPENVSRTSRRLFLSSEAAKRFERGLDPDLPPVASARASSLLAEYGGANEAGAYEHDLRSEIAQIELDPEFPAKYVGANFTVEEVRSALGLVGCRIETGPTWLVTPPSWRVDLRNSADLTEEVARICGYERIPSLVPAARPSAGLTNWQRQRRTVQNYLVGAGLTETLNYPFVGVNDFDLLGFAAEDRRRIAIELHNPISLEQPMLRTTLLPPLLSTFKRNLGRGISNVAIYEMGKVVLPDNLGQSAPRPKVDTRPSDSELAAIDEVVPPQPTYVAGVMTGVIERGDASDGAIWDWKQALAVAVNLASALPVTVEVVAANEMPWHPGRCGAIVVSDLVFGFAGELHPRVCETLGLPARSVAFEIDLTALSALAAGTVTAKPVASFPPALVDVALVVKSETPAESVRSVLLQAAGALCESVTLFDIYTGEQVPKDCKSLAYNLRFRALDRTLTDAEVLSLRDAAVAAAIANFGATLR